MSRKFSVKELRSLMHKVAELSITTDAVAVRRHCRQVGFTGVVYKCVMDYCIDVLHVKGMLVASVCIYSTCWIMISLLVVNVLANIVGCLCAVYFAQILNCSQNLF